jgi:hypothetical protein
VALAGLHHLIEQGPPRGVHPASGDPRETQGGSDQKWCVYFNEPISEDWNSDILNNPTENMLQTK